MSGELQRPRTRGECLRMPRPCPFIGCRFALVLDVVPATSPRRRANTLELAPDHDGCRPVMDGGPVDVDTFEAFGDAAIERLVELEDTCALDVADRGELPAAAVGELAGVTAGQVRRVARKYRRLLLQRLAEARRGA